MCEAQKFFQQSFNIYLLIEAGLFIFILAAFIMAWRSFRGFIYRILSGPVFILIYLFLSFLITVYFGFVYWLDDRRPSVLFHQMNAAIKNTCYVDPEKLNCPKNFVEVLRLYPQDFRPLLDRFVFTYEYRDSDQTYTLIARPKQMMEFKNQVSIFDPRLITTDTEYDTKGVDFADTKAYSCNGKFKLESPPPFEGPWDKIN
jgi:hypothetical protein